MTPEDRERLLICRKVIADCIENKPLKGKVRKTHVGPIELKRLKMTLADIDQRLTEPVEIIDYKGEHFKTNNPFI